MQRRCRGGEVERRRGIGLLGEEERRGGLEEVGRMGGGEEGSA